MRATNLLKVAAEAEYLRIQHLLKRQGMRAAIGLVAVIFALCTLAWVNVIGWQIVQLFVQSPIYTTLIMLGINLLLAVICIILAARNTPSRTEQEALELRRRALDEARGSFALSAVVPVAGALLRSRRRPAERQSFWRRLR
jgi:type VI protein secretion system component VasK